MRISLPLSAQRRPGDEPPANPIPDQIVQEAHGPLNEGRGTNPRRTPLLALLRVQPLSAQRRPGDEPPANTAPGGSCSPRAVAQRRPGDEPPANPSTTCTWDASPTALNEGRGTNPRRTRGRRRGRKLRLTRSTKAGGRTPGELVVVPSGVVDGVLRSTKAGGRTPGERPASDGRP